MHVQAAKVWLARLRLERGESTAIDELMALVRSHLPPQLYAHVAFTVLRANAKYDDPDSPVNSSAVLRAVIGQLERASCVRGALGERAKRWLQKVETKSASFFSQ